MNTCPVCQTAFTKRGRQKYCSRKCAHDATNNSARTCTRAAHQTQFIGVDGEGVNIVLPDGTKTHRYVMLSVGDETLWKNGQELTHLDIFPFLYEQYSNNSDAAFVGFFLGYDFTQWLKSMREERAVMLFNPERRKRTKSGNNPTPFPARMDGWECDILGLKRFKLRPEVPIGVKPYSWMYVCDAGPFFQKSFLSVVEPTDKKWPASKPCNPQEYEILAEGKGKRANEIVDGDTSYLTDMVRYNRLENDVLARTMAIVNSGFVEAGIRLNKTQYYGPGQVAQYWLREQSKKVPLLLHKDLEETLPSEIVRRTRESYYGGWFEQMYHGHVPGTSYEYDITSAYPYIMSTLPCLCGRWINADKPDAIVKLRKATVYGHDNNVGAMPYRNLRGNILRPYGATGWYWQHEIDAAERAGILTGYVGSNVWSYMGCNHNPPLTGLADLFLQRLKVGKATPQGVGLKLTYNSAYGKFAQSVGLPKFGNPVYASLITAGTRAIICDAIATHPAGTGHLLMVATDAVYFRTPHPTLCSQDLVMGESPLGGWESGEKQNLTLMKPGVYWDDTTRQQIRDHQQVTLKSRGISARSLAENIGKIDDMFSVLADDLSAPWPELDISVPFSIVSPKLALSRGKWGTCGKVTWDAARVDKCNLAPKRMQAYQDHGMIRSRPLALPLERIETTPYDKRFGFEEQDPNHVGEVLPDGTADHAYGGWVQDLQSW